MKLTYFFLTHHLTDMLLYTIAKIKMLILVKKKQNFYFRVTSLCLQKIEVPNRGESRKEMPRKKATAEKA